MSMYAVKILVVPGALPGPIVSRFADTESNSGIKAEAIMAL